MTKQLNLLILALTFSLTSFGQAKNNISNKTVKMDTVQPDTSIFVVLSYDSNQNWMFNDCVPSELTNNDLIKIDNILCQSIDEYNAHQKIKYEKAKEKYPIISFDESRFFIHLNRYKRQYIAVTNKKGDREVWVNCFCDPLGTNWKESLILVLDGGNCFFNLKINLTTGKFYELMVNGEA